MRTLVIKSTTVTKSDSCTGCGANLGESPDPELEWEQVEQLTKISVGHLDSDINWGSTTSICLCDQCLLKVAEQINRAAEEARER